METKHAKRKEKVVQGKFFRTKVTPEKWIKKLSKETLYQSKRHISLNRQWVSDGKIMVSCNLFTPEQLGEFPKEGTGFPQDVIIPKERITMNYAFSFYNEDEETAYYYYTDGKGNYKKFSDTVLQSASNLIGITDAPKQITGGEYYNTPSIIEEDGQVLSVFMPMLLNNEDEKWIEEYGKPA